MPKCDDGPLLGEGDPFLNFKPFHNLTVKCYFTIWQTQLYRSCTSGLCSVLLHASAVHISYHHI